MQTLTKGGHASMLCAVYSPCFRIDISKIVNERDEGTDVSRSEVMIFDAFIRGLFAMHSSRWRMRAMRARAAFQQEHLPSESALPATNPRVEPPWGKLAELRRIVSHLGLLILVLLAIVSDRLISLPRQAPSSPLGASSHSILDQQLLLAIAPLPLRIVAAETQNPPALAPLLREPIVPPELFQAQHSLADGETLGAIAARYTISLESLIWVNQLEQGDALLEGQVLRIPRISGVLHAIAPGETLAMVAAVYGVSPEVIFSFAPNRIDAIDSTTPLLGTEIFIPGGTRMLPEGLLSAYGGQEGLSARGPVLAGIILADETNIRDGPSTEHQRIFQLEAGRQVALQARYKDWLYITLGSRSGWLRNDLIQVDSTLLAELVEKTDFPEPPPRWVWPARGTITSRFGARWGGFHNGLDIANRAWTPIVAARSGVVREAGWCRGYGYCVKIRHPGGVETIYGHLIAQPVVGAGDTVTAGQLIGHMGSTYDRAGGGYSTGVHLHLTVIIGGRAVDPLKVLP